MDPNTASPAPDLRVLDNVPGYTRTLARGYAVEESYRERSYLDLAEKICGIQIGPLTLQAYLQFCRISSPFICGGRMPGIHDVAFFLFRLSPAYDRARAAKEAAHTRIAKAAELSWLELRAFAWANSLISFPRSLVTRHSSLVTLIERSADQLAASAFITVRREFAEQVRAIDYSAALRGIDRFVDRMLLDKPIGSRGGPPSDPADTSVPADIIHLMAGAYSWSRDEILQLPMPEVFQALRKIQRDMPGCPKRARAKVHPYATRLTRKHRKISEDAALVAAGVSPAEIPGNNSAGETPAPTP